MTRVAIFGAGLMGRWHLSAARRAGAQVIGVVDSDLSAAARLARGVAGATAEVDPTRLLSDENLQAIHVCTPAATHFDLATRALEAGINALVEKPLAADAGDTATLLDLAGAANLQLCPVHQYAFQPGMDVARARLAELGSLRRIDFDICSAGATGHFAEYPDAVLAEILPHPLSILQAFVPSPSLDRIDWQVLHPAPGEMLATGDLGGVIATISISMSARPTRFRARLQGVGGTLALDGFHGFATLHRSATSRTGKLAAPFEDGARQLAGAGANLAGRLVRWEPAYPGLQALVRRFYAAIDGSGPAPIAREDILAGAKARDAILDKLRVSPEARHG